MSQADLNIADQPGSTFLTEINQQLQALGTLMSGATEPGTTYAHMLWADTTANVLKKRNAANTGWIALRTLDETFVLQRGSNTALGVSDRGKLIVATAGFTQTFTAAATLGDGWWCAYNARGYTIILDPNSSEQIDGAATKTVTGSGFIFCTGTAFYTTGFTALTASGSITASGYTQSTSRLLGRTTASSGAIEEISVGTNLTLSGGVLSASSTATPAGSSGALQYNNSGSLGGAVITGLVKGNGASAPSAAAAGTDYVASVTTVGSGGQSVFAGMSGGAAQIRQVIGVTDGPGEATGRIAVSVDGSGNIEIKHIPAVGGGNSSIHPDSAILMADGSEKWLRDIRVGDVVAGRNGPAEVLGIWMNTLQERALWEVNGVGCTPGHLFWTPAGWAAPSPQHYLENSHGKKRVVKGRGGMIETECLLADPDNLPALELGMPILCADGEFRPVTVLREFPVSGEGRRITENQVVYALYLDGSDIFFADGVAVATLA